LNVKEKVTFATRQASQQHNNNNNNNSMTTDVATASWQAPPRPPKESHRLVALDDPQDDPQEHPQERMHIHPIAAWRLSAFPMTLGSQPTNNNDNVAAMPAPWQSLPVHCQVLAIIIISMHVILPWATTRMLTVAVLRLLP
jgi:hypothetical protein